MYYLASGNPLLGASWLAYVANSTWNNAHALLPEPTGYLYYASLVIKFLLLLLVFSLVFRIGVGYSFFGIWFPGAKDSVKREGEYCEMCESYYDGILYHSTLLGSCVHKDNARLAVALYVMFAVCSLCCVALAACRILFPKEGVSLRFLLLFYFDWQFAFVICCFSAGYIIYRAKKQ